jgi:hypothetical protein
MIRILAILLLVLIASPAWGQFSGASIYVDSTVVGGLGDGSSQANAYSSIEAAVEAARNSFDHIWVRRVSKETPGSDIAPLSTGTAERPIRVSLWPRAATTINNTDWQAGVTGFQANSGSTNSWICREVVDPSGMTYFITGMHPSGITMFIDRPWAGTSNYMNTACTLVKDDLYDQKPADVVGWDNDWAGLPLIDFNGGAFRINLADAKRFWEFYGIAVKNANGTGGCFNLASGQGSLLSGVSIIQPQNKPAVASSSGTLIKNSVFQGDASNSSSQFGISASGLIKLKNVALTKFYYGISTTAPIDAVGLNIGVEAPLYSGGADFRVGSSVPHKLSNVWFSGSGSGGYVSYGTYPSVLGRLAIENWYKVVGRHRIFTPQGVLERTAISLDSQVPAQRTHGNTGAEYLIEGTYNLTSSSAYLTKATQDYSVVAFTHEYDADTTSKTYRYYIADNYDGSTAGGAGYTHTSGTTKFWLEAEYIKAYSSVSNYVTATASGVTTFSGTTNWQNQPNYVEITIQPATASKVRILGKVSAYTDKTVARRWWIDPRPYVY